MRELKEIKLTPRIQEILTYYFNYPTSSYKEIAEHFGISIQRISQIMNHPRVLEAHPILAKRRIKSLVPKAVGKLEELMMQTTNMNVSEKVVSKILDSEKVLEPQERKIVHELQFKSTQDLQKIIQDAQALPQPVFEAEIVSDTAETE